MKENEEVWCMTTEMTPNTSLNVAPCLRARDYKDPPCVCFGLDSWNQSVCEEILPVLRGSGGGEQSPKVIAVYDDTE